MGTKVPKSFEGKQILQPGWFGNLPYIRKWIYHLITYSACIWGIRYFLMWFMEYYWTYATSFPVNLVLLPPHHRVFGILTSCWWSILALPVWALKYMERRNLLLSFFLLLLETSAHTLRQSNLLILCSDPKNLQSGLPCTVCESKLFNSWILWCYPILRATIKSHPFQCSFSSFGFLVPQILLSIELIYKYTCQTKYSLQPSPIFFVCFVCNALIMLMQWIWLLWSLTSWYLKSWNSERTCLL